MTDRWTVLLRSSDRCPDHMQTIPKAIATFTDHDGNATENVTKKSHLCTTVLCDYVNYFSLWNVSGGAIHLCQVFKPRLHTTFEINASNLQLFYGTVYGAQSSLGEIPNFQILD